MKLFSRHSAASDLTLGLIGTWQVFDQVFLMTTGGPNKTSLTPAYLSYTYAFESQQWGTAAAMAFALFVIIIIADTPLRDITYSVSTWGTYSMSSR